MSQTADRDGGVSARRGGVGPRAEAATAVDQATPEGARELGHKSLFKGIEGARAWLAWAVVGTHIATYTGVTTAIRHGHWLHVPGDYAVQVFIVISGFVITHLIMSKSEPYGLYIARRCLRIFPAYLICLLLAILIAPLSFEAVEAYRFSEPYQQSDFLRLAQQYKHNLWEHIGAHLLLMQGAISNFALPDSQVMFLPAAWSLSLEWQFYLVAPAWIFALRRFPTVTVVASLAAWVLYVHFLSDGYGLPSFLPGAILYFLLGMGTRLLIERAPRLQAYPYAAVIGVSVLVLLSKELVPLVLWIALVAYFLQPKKWAVLDSRLARAAGARSYAVYIIHLPFVFLGLYLAERLHIIDQFKPTVAFVTVVTGVGTLIGSELLYRFIETPAIDFARRLGQRRAPISPQAEASGW